ASAHPARADTFGGGKALLSEPPPDARLVVDVGRAELPLELLLFARRRRAATARSFEGAPGVLGAGMVPVERRKTAKASELRRNAKSPQVIASSEISVRWRRGHACCVRQGVMGHAATGAWCRSPFAALPGVDAGRSREHCRSDLRAGDRRDHDCYQPEKRSVGATFSAAC